MAFDGVPEPRVHVAEEARQVTLLRQRIQVSRARERLAHVVARRGHHRAERDHRRAERAHEPGRRVGQRGLATTRAQGSVPSATSWASVMIAVTMTIVMISAKGIAVRGSFASPPGTGTTSYPPKANISSSALVES